MEEIKKRITCIIFDVDGVFTDGSVYVDSRGGEMLRFSRIDGKGVELIKNRGIKTAVISSEDSSIIEKRMKKLSIDKIMVGVADKEKAYGILKNEWGIEDSQICFCGDDLQDLEVMKRVGFSACPANARDEIKAIADFVSKKEGGDGFVRDICERILRS